MKYYPICYSAKVWLGSILIGPLLAALLEYCISGNLESAELWLVFLYPPAVLAVVFFSFFTWLLFWAIINLIIRIAPGLFPQKCLITFVGMVLTLGTFHLVFPDEPFSPKSELFHLMSGYILGITAGVWYFDLARPIILLEL